MHNSCFLKSHYPGITNRNTLIGITLIPVCSHSSQRISLQHQGLGRMSPILVRVLSHANYFSAKRLIGLCPQLPSSQSFPLLSPSRHGPATIVHKRVSSATRRGSVRILKINRTVSGSLLYAQSAWDPNLKNVGSSQRPSAPVFSLLHHFSHHLFGERR